MCVSQFRSLSIFKVLFLLLSVIASSAAQADHHSSDAVKWPKMLILMRHAEDNENDLDLLPQGEKRAEAIADTFTSPQGIWFKKVDPKSIAGIFACHPVQIDDDGTENPLKTSHSMKTVLPLAHALNLKLDAKYKPQNADKAGDYILGLPALYGKVGVIAWTHENLPTLALALGASKKDVPKKWQGGIFNKFWILTYSAPKPGKKHPEVSFKEVDSGLPASYPAH